MRPALPICVLVASVCALAAAAQPYRAPRTPDGQPSLEGLWTNSSVTMLQRPPVFKGLIATDQEARTMEGMFARMVAASDITGPTPVDPKLPKPKEVKEVDNSEWVEMDMHLAKIGGQKRSSWIVEPADGRLPLSDAGKALNKVANGMDDDTSGPEARPTADRCLTGIGSPEGPPMMNTGYDANYQFVQTPGQVAIFIEMNHATRIVRLGDKAHPPAHLPPDVRPWMGDSVGWWEGETLVVETTNLHPGSYVWSLGGGFGFSDRGKVTERFTRTAKDQILYGFSVDDPVMFTRVWRAEMPFRPAKGPTYEYACHEGNYALPNILAGGRAQEAAPPAPASPAGR